MSARPTLTAAAGAINDQKQAAASPEKLTADQVITLGEKMFGAHWRPRMGEAFGVERQTVYQWSQNGVKRRKFSAYLAGYLLRARKALDEAEKFITD